MPTASLTLRESDAVIPHPSGSNPDYVGEYSAPILGNPWLQLVPASQNVVPLICSYDDDCHVTRRFTHTVMKERYKNAPDTADITPIAKTATSTTPRVHFK